MAISLKAIARMPYFQGLTPDGVKGVKKMIAHEKRVEKGQMILSEDDKSEYIYFIVSGAVKVYKRSANGKEQILNVATNGESLNDVATFDGGASAANMLAMTPVRLYAIKIKDMERLFYENPQIARNVARVLASRVRRDSSLVEVLSFGQVISRLAGLILKQGAAIGGNRLPHFTQQDLAAMVGSSRVVVNRSLGIMEEKGAIRLERRRIVIIDESILRSLV